MKFNEKLLQLRKMHGFSQEQLAELLEVSRQAVSKWELGEAMPEAEKLVRISDCFHVSLDCLLREDATLQQNVQEKRVTFDMQRVMPGVARCSAWTLLSVGAFLIVALGDDGAFIPYWPLSRMILGMILQVLAVGGYEMIRQSVGFSKKEVYRFWRTAVWLFAVTPLVLLIKAAKVLLFNSGELAFAAALLCVLVGCIVSSIHLRRSANKEE